MAPQPTRPAPPEDFVDFCAALAARSGVPAARLAAPGTTLAEVVVDELGLGTVVAGLQDLNPDAQIPEQLEPHLVTVADLHHFARTMGPDHRAPAPGEETP